MANSQEEQPKSTIQPEENLPQPAKNSPLFQSPIFSIVLALIAFILALYAIFMTHQANQQRALQTETVNDLTYRFEKQQTMNKEDLNNFKEIQKESEANLQNQMQELNKNLQNSISQNLYQQQDWLLLKVRYLLELAQINAHWSADQQTTIALLKEADSLLATLSSQEIFSIRQEIAKEINQLEAISEVDRPGLLSKLDAAQDLLLNLPLKNKITSSPKQLSTATTWQEELKNSLGKLEKLVIIRRNDEALQNLISPSAQLIVRESIQLNLQQAQWAIMQNSPEVYQATLNRALEGIKRIFNENAEPTQTLIKQLQELKEIKLQKSQVKLENSLNLLNKVIEQNKPQSIQTSPTPKGGNAQ